MTSLLSVLTLMILAAWLSNLDRIQWPLQRTEPIYDTGYWQAVLQNSVDYLKRHDNLSPEVKREVNRAITNASRRIAKGAR